MAIKRARQASVLVPRRASSLFQRIKKKLTSYMPQVLVPRRASSLFQPILACLQPSTLISVLVPRRASSLFQPSVESVLRFQANVLVPRRASSLFQQIVVVCVCSRIGVLVPRRASSLFQLNGISPQAISNATGLSAPKSIQSISTNSQFPSSPIA